MIDEEKVKHFWESRAASYEKVALESVANLEQDPNNLELKINDEVAKVFAWLPDIEGLSVLDLGAGVGQWSFRFAERDASRVLAVEYAESLVDIGRKEAEKKGFKQVEFENSSAEAFDTTEQFDLVFISGLFVYLNKDQADKLLSHLGNFIRPGGILMLRDGTGTNDGYEINDRYSEHLDANYSAIYRTRGEYVTMIENWGLQLIQDENMFPEGHPLNKYPETRLRLYKFGKAV